jgi:NADPH2:quinone reductase
MRAALVTELTGVDGLRIDEIERPSVGIGEVLIAVRSVGLSFADLLMARGTYQAVPETPFVIGMDLAGDVVEVGSGVSRFTVGDRVAATLPYGAGAEYVSVPEHSVFALPAVVSYEHGAALPLNYLTAYFALVVRAQLRPGEIVLVHGAAGGVGGAAVQITRALGARAIAVVSNEAKAAFAREHGADEVVLAAGFKETVMQATEGAGVDVVIDTIGAPVLDDSLRCLAFGGRHMVVGFTGGDGPPTVRANRLLLRNVDVRGVGWGGHTHAGAAHSAAQWDALAPLIEQGALSPAIGAVHELGEIADALADIGGRRAMGKIIVNL